MSEVLLTKKTEEKRLMDFQKIAENWDNLPEYAQGKLDGIIYIMASMCITSDSSKKSG